MCSIKSKINGWQSLGVFLLFGFSVLLQAADNKVKPIDWSPHKKISCRLNLGPTGATAWLRGDNFEIVKIDKGSPADGILQLGDLVVGVDGITFSPETDSRIILGNAIGEAEAKDSKLSLTLIRNGKKQSLTVQLPVTGPYSATWPYACPKSQRILDEACLRLLEIQMPNGEFITDGGFGTFLNGLLLLSSGEPRFMDGARRAVYVTADKDIIKIDYHNWAIGYAGILMAEFFLQTGDKSVLPKLKEITDHLAKGQMKCGSWGHRGPSGGYGALNQPGITCAMSMVLAKECGIKVDEKALKKSIDFYAQFAELGAVPYGDHTPGRYIPDDNGKNSTAAILCALYPEMNKEADLFAKSVAISYWLREEGHTGGFFSIMWGPIACKLDGAESLREFMDYQKWFYNLSRNWKGGLVMQPYFEALNRFDGGTYVDSGDKFTTGGMGLLFAMPHRKLRILGAEKSIFSAKIDGPLLEARDAYQNRDWKAYETALKKIQNVSGMTEDENRWFRQLKDAVSMLNASAELTIKEIDKNIIEGDAYLAEEQYLALKRFLGENDERILDLDKKFEDSTIQWYAREGKRYYKALQEMETISFMGWVPYGDRARSATEGMPGNKLPHWDTLLMTIDEKQKVEAKAAEPAPAPLVRKFNLNKTDYKALKLLIRSPRKSHIQVKLNGELVCNIVRAKRSGFEKIQLDKSALKLLKKGSNELSVTTSSPASGKNALDYGLDAIPKQYPREISPVWQDPTPLSEDAIPPTLRKVLKVARDNL